MTPKDRYEINDIVYVHMGGPDNRLQRGTIVHIFEQYGHILYVIEIDTGIDPIYEVRNWSVISETSIGPVNFLR